MLFYRSISKKTGAVSGISPDLSLNTVPQKSGSGCVHFGKTLKAPHAPHIPRTQARRQSGAGHVPGHQMPGPLVDPR